TAQPSITMPRNRNSAGANRELRVGAIAEGMGKPEGVTDGREASMRRDISRRAGGGENSQYRAKRRGRSSSGQHGVRRGRFCFHFPNREPDGKIGKKLFGAT